MAVFGCAVLLSAVSKVASLPFFRGGFFMGVFFGVKSNVGSAAFEPFKSCFSGVLASGALRSMATGATIFWRLLEVGSRGLFEPWWLYPVEGVLLAFCGGVGFSRFPLGVEMPLVFVRPVPSFLLMLWVFSLSWAARSVAASEFMWGWMTLGLLGGSLGVSLGQSALLSDEELWKLLIFFRAFWTTPLICSMWLGLLCSSADFFPRTDLCLLGEPFTLTSFHSCFFCCSEAFSFIFCCSSLLAEPSLELLFFSFATVSTFITPCCSGWGEPGTFPCIHETLGLVEGSGGRGFVLPGEGGGFPLRFTSGIRAPSPSLLILSSSLECLEGRAMRA